MAAAVATGSSDEDKFLDRARDAGKKKNFEYAVTSYLDVLKRNPAHPEARKELLACSRERRRAGQTRTGPLEKPAFLPRKTSLLALGILLMLIPTFILVFPSGKPDDPNEPAGLPINWILGLPTLAAFAAFVAISPWPRLLLWARRGNHEKVFDLTSRLLLTEPEHIDLLQAHAEAAVASGQQAAAIAVCEWTLGIVPDYVPTLHLLGSLYHKHVKDIPRAQQCYNRILNVVPTDIDASRAIKNLAAEHTMAQGVESAATSGTYRDMLKSKKESEKLEDQAKVLKTADEIQKAISYKQEELEKKPDDFRLWRDMGDLQARLKDWAESEKAYRKAIALDPVNPSLKMKLGDLTLRRHDNEILTLRQSLKTNPADAAAKARLAAVERERWQSAAEEFDWRAKEYPTDAGIRFHYGEALFRTGRVSDAIAEFQFSVKDQKFKTNSLMRLGECFRREGKLDLSGKQYERALEDMPIMNEPRKAALYALGDVYEKQGRLEEAKKAWNELYEADINHRDVSKRLDALNAKLKAPPG